MRACVLLAPVGALRPNTNWKIECHQFRIEARSDAPGRPTPEGVRRDGVDYALVLLINRTNIKSGTTTVHDLDGIAGELTLTAALDAAIVDDARVKHGVTAVEPIDPGCAAYRDVLVVAEATALIVKVFSGVLSDYWRKRKSLAVIGYTLGALSKPLFAIASTAGMVFTARFIDRIGKGIRGAPRDALVADVAPSEMRGAAFGLRQSLDTVGAFIGPLLALGLMLLWANDFRAVFWVAVIPAVLAVVLLVFGVREPERDTATRPINPIRRASLRKLSRAILVGGSDRRSVHAGALQRSVSRAACSAGRIAARAGAIGADRHERGLFAFRVSVRAALGSHQPCAAADVGPCSADRRRRRARIQQPVGVGMARRFALGFAHGHHARTAWRQWWPTQHPRTCVARRSDFLILLAEWRC